MELSFSSRLRHAWDVFRNREPTYDYQDTGPGSSFRPDRIRLSGGNERSIVTSIFNRIALDVSSINIKHCRIDDNGRFKESINSSLDNCLNLEANIDQTGRAFMQDVVMSMLDEGCVAIVPTDTTIDPNATTSYDIQAMRTGKILEWYPNHVRVRVYNEKTGKQEDIKLPKSMYDKLMERDDDNPITVYDGDVLLFTGFIYELGKEFYLDGKVKCKGELDYLSESIVRPYSTLQNGYGNQPPTSVNGYFEWLISQHNEQVKDNKRFTVGINQGANLDPNNYIYRESTKYPTTWKEIGEKLLDDLGGYLRIRHEGDTRYIDYLSEWTDTNTQILDFGKNLTDYTQTDDSESIATFIVPLGARMSDTGYSYNDGYYQTTDKTMSSEKEYYTKSDNGYTKVSDDVTAFESGVIYYEYFELYDESSLSLTIVGLEDKEYDTEGYRKSGDIVYSESAVQK